MQNKKRFPKCGFTQEVRGDNVIMFTFLWIVTNHEIHNLFHTVFHQSIDIMSGRRKRSSLGGWDGLCYSSSFVTTGLWGGGKDLLLSTCLLEQYD